MAGRGTGAPCFLKCSTCNRADHDYQPGELWRTGKTKPKKTNNVLPRMTRTLVQLWCSYCGNYMWSAHMQAADKPLIHKVDLYGNEEE